MHIEQRGVWYVMCGGEVVAIAPTKEAAQKWIQKQEAVQCKK